MSKFLLLLIASIIVLINASSYSMSGSVTCSERNITTGSCNTWTISSSIDEKTSCFPEDTLVIVNDTLIKIGELKKGDVMHGFDHNTNTIVKTIFIDWFHFEKLNTCEFVEIQIIKGALVVSAHHNIAYYKNEQIVYDYAMNGINYDMLFDGIKGIQIKNISTIIRKGIYSPMTNIQNFFVSLNDTILLVHTFSHIKNPLTVQIYYNKAISLLNWMYPNNIQYDKLTEFFNPNVRILTNIFGFLIDVDKSNLENYLVKRQNKMLSGLTYKTTPSTRTSTTNSNNHDDTIKMLSSFHMEIINTIVTSNQ